MLSFNLTYLNVCETTMCLKEIVQPEVFNIIYQERININVLWVTLGDTILDKITKGLLCLYKNYKDCVKLYPKRTRKPP